MRIRTTCALAVAALTVAVPVAAAAPDGYQPQLQDIGIRTPDGYQPQLRAQPNSAGAAAHPDSQAVRPSVVVQPEPSPSDGFSFSWGSGVVGAIGGGLIALLAVAGASAMRERRPFVLH
jgi:hypothetical protein